MLSVSVRALVSPLAPLMKFPVIAHLGLLLAFVFFDVLLPFRLIFELLVAFLGTVAVSGAIRGEVFTIPSAKLLGFRHGEEFYMVFHLGAISVGHLRKIGREEFKVLMNSLAVRIREEGRSLGSETGWLLIESSALEIRVISGGQLHGRGGHHNRLE
jgi:hypothetical protein